jgi:hypothetical protein
MRITNEVIVLRLIVITIYSIKRTNSYIVLLLYIVLNEVIVLRLIIILYG